MRKLEHARCAPTSDEEQAVSMLTLGPLRPSVKEMRPQTALSVPLVAVYALMPCGRVRAVFSDVHQKLLHIIANLFAGHCQHCGCFGIDCTWLT